MKTGEYVSRGSGGDRYLSACIEAAHAGGRVILGWQPSTAVKKGDPHVGHHAVVSDADYRSQRAILEVLAPLVGDNRVICEETSSADRAASQPASGQPADSPGAGVFLVDELDGSSSYAVGHYEWSISVGYIEALVHYAGAVYAPAIGRGWAFHAARGKGAFLAEGGGTLQTLRVSPTRQEDAYVLMGPDMLLAKYPAHNRLALVVADACRTVNISGSCALALGLVAAGRAQLLIQPPQCPWDWAAGRLLVEEAGGVVLFYEVGEDGIVRAEQLEPRHYDPERRAVGLIAGPTDLVEVAFERLVTLAGSP